MTSTTTTDAPARACGGTAYGVVSQCGGAPLWDIVVRNADGAETVRHPVCLTHSLAEISTRLGDDPAGDIDIIRMDG